MKMLTDAVSGRAIPSNGVDGLTWKDRSPWDCPFCKSHVGPEQHHAVVACAAEQMEVLRRDFLGLMAELLKIRALVAPTASTPFDAVLMASKGG